MSKQEFGRRDFLKMAGIGTAVGGAALAASTVAPKQAKAEYEKPASKMVNMCIKYLDTPGYNLPPYADGDKLTRTDMATHSGDAINARNGVGETKEEKAKRMYEQVKNNKLGYTKLDYAFDEASWTLQFNPFLKSWTSELPHPLGKSSRPMLDKFEPWQDTPENNSMYVKKVAKYYGAKVVGTCKLKEQWIWGTTTGNKIPLVISDKFTEPKQTPTEWQIPKKMDNVIMVGVEQDTTITDFNASRFATAAIHRSYSYIAFSQMNLLTFIRSLGYHAIALLDFNCLLVPLAIDAGLGELNRFGICTNPVLGANFRLGGVLTDLPLAPDKPISFGVAEFCRTCKKCANACPSKSISFETEPSYDIQCEANHAGMKKWYVNLCTCAEYGSKVEGCFVCSQVCTYSKPQTWVHDVVKLTASKTSIFNSIFAKMDDAFGYGQTAQNVNPTKEDYDRWWSEDLR